MVHGFFSRMLAVTWVLPLPHEIGGTEISSCLFCIQPLGACSQSAVELKRPMLSISSTWVLVVRAYDPGWTHSVIRYAFMSYSTSRLLLSSDQLADKSTRTFLFFSCLRIVLFSLSRPVLSLYSIFFFFFRTLHLPSSSLLFFAWNSIHRLERKNKNQPLRHSSSKLIAFEPLTFTCRWVYRSALFWNIPSRTGHASCARCCRKFWNNSLHLRVHLLQRTGTLASDRADVSILFSYSQQKLENPPTSFLFVVKCDLYLNISMPPRCMLFFSLLLLVTYRFLTDSDGLIISRGIKK